VLCVHRVAAINPASAASLLSEPVVALTELPWSPPICTCFATYSPCASPAIDPPPSPTIDLATPVSILDDPYKSVRPFVSFGTIASDKCILTVSVTRTSTLLPNFPIATGIDNCPICLKVRGYSVVQSSKDSERVRHLSGSHGETCYVHLRDLFSSTLYGAALRSKAPPIE
jgi:hypothetical protein